MGCDLLVDSKCEWEGWKQTDNEETSPHFSFCCTLKGGLLVSKELDGEKWGDNQRLAECTCNLWPPRTLGSCMRRYQCKHLYRHVHIDKTSFKTLLCLFVWGTESFFLAKFLKGRVLQKIFNMSRFFWGPESGIRFYEGVQPYSKEYIKKIA